MPLSSRWLQILSACLLAAAVALAAGAAEPAVNKPLALPPLRPNATFSPAGWEAARKIAQRDDPRSRPGEPVVHRDGPREYVVCNILFENEEACRQYAPPGVHFLSRYQKFADAFIPSDETGKPLDGALDKKQWKIVWSDEVTIPFQPPPQPLVREPGTSKSIIDDIVRGGIGDLKGKGVTIAVFDSGIDFRHPDFISYDDEDRPTSRLKYFWDCSSTAWATARLGKPAPATFPSGAPIGTIFSQDDLTAELRRVRPRIATYDTNGHGTACAGIAAGNGNASEGRLRGVAPEADLIVIGVGANLDYGFIQGAALDWLDSVVGDKPLVVTCSFGSHEGGHDGTRIEERQLDARFADSRRGRAICLSAGNEGDKPIHASFDVRGEQRRDAAVGERRADRSADLRADR